MLRKMLLVFGLCMVTAVSAQAQDDDKVEVFGGYTYMHFNSSPNANLNGWEASAQYKFRDWIGGVADFDGHYGSIRGIGTSFSMAIGGGIDYTLTDKFRWRLIQGDYLLTQFGGRSQSNARISTGIIFRF
ncbi:MAG TPA: hypothetical protein VGI46_01305 [Candidatus Acidoferrum sp.]|jgi:opacity protein-like surface antigen